MYIFVHRQLSECRSALQDSTREVGNLHRELQQQTHDSDAQSEKFAREKQELEAQALQRQQQQV